MQLISVLAAPAAPTAAPEPCATRVLTTHHGGACRQTHAACGLGDVVEHALLMPRGHGALARLVTLARREAELPGFFTQFQGHTPRGRGCVTRLMVGHCGGHGLAPPWRSLERFWT